MKKSFIFATMAAAALFAGCSSSDDLASNPGGDQGVDVNADLVAIEIGVGSPSAAMRGTGTVGGVTDYDTNPSTPTEVSPTYWAGQKINVYMLNKGTMNIARFVKADQTSEDIYNNAVLTTPSYTGDDPSVDGTASGIAKYIDEATGTYHGLPFIKYYPPTGQFDFWGYRIDDATTTAAPVVGDNDIKVTFTVDGTQDVLAAQTIETFADLSAARQTAIQGGEATFDATTTAGTRYSASAARKGIQPELLFKHMMTRLTFQAKAGTPSIAADYADENNPVPAANPVYVTGISVRPVKTVGATIEENTYVSTTGTLTVAWKPGSEPRADNPQMAWGVADPADNEAALVLKKRPAAAVAPEKIENSQLVDIVDPNNNNYATNGAVGLKYKSNGATDAEKFVKTPIGESIIAPDAQAYEVTIKLAQKLPKHDTTGSSLSQDDIDADMTEMAYNTVKVVVRPPSTTEEHPAFLPGYSYNLLCTVYGLERIEITATLEPWKQGEEIEVIGE